MTTPSEALADSIAEDLAVQGAGEPDVTDDTVFDGRPLSFWKVVIAALRSAPVPSVATLHAAETAPHPAGGDGVDELAYRFWSIHPKELDPWRASMPEEYKGGVWAWFFACEMRAQVATARSEALEEAAKVVEGKGPASQDMTSTMICEALDDAAAAIRALKENDR